MIHSNLNSILDGEKNKSKNTKYTDFNNPNLTHEMLKDTSFNI